MVALYFLFVVRYMYVADWLMLCMLRMWLIFLIGPCCVRCVCVCGLRFCLFYASYAVYVDALLTLRMYVWLTLLLGLYFLYGCVVFPFVRIFVLLGCVCNLCCCLAYAPCVAYAYVTYVAAYAPCDWLLCWLKPLLFALERTCLCVCTGTAVWLVGSEQ